LIGPRVPASRNLRSHAEDAPPDLAMAARLLDQANRHLTSAAIKGVDRDSRFGLLYDGARKAADAIMRAKGRRVTHGVGHHLVFLSEAKRLLGPSQAAMWTRVEAARSIRNAMEYQGREVTQLEVDELTEAATELVAAARGFVEAAG
jgi:hypothetical protein